MLPLLDAAETPQNNLSSAQCLYSQRHPTHLVVTARKYTVWSKVNSKTGQSLFSSPYKLHWMLWVYAASGWDSQLHCIEFAMPLTSELVKATWIRQPVNWL